jgi:hypothetical protein
MEQSTKEKVLQSIENLKNKKNRVYFFVQDTKGNAKASVRFIYQMALTLKNNGYNSIILHEKNDYDGVKSWLGETYMTELEHKSLEGQNLEISPEDFIVLPEIFGYVMEQIKNIPCGKIVLSQLYSYIVETLQPGQSWNQLGFLKCITTTNKQKEYLETVMRNVSYDVVSPVISDDFNDKKQPPLPIIAVHTREQSDTINLIKTFYLKFPQYRWFTFKDMRGLSELEFATSLKECCLSVWIDDKSSFGTFPLESMACGVPVLGKIPDLQPDWINEDNGLWVNEPVLLPDFIADFMQNWLEDNIDPKLYEQGKVTAEKYKNKNEFDQKVLSLFENYSKVRLESFENQISKTEE